MPEETRFRLVVAIVPEGGTSPIVEAAKKAGAEGATIVPGRGSGVHEGAKFLGVPIEPEKEILLILVDRGVADAVLDGIVRAGKLDRPGKGIAFILDVPRVAGIVHRGEVFGEDG